MAQPLIVGVHHVKFPVSDLQRSRAWYERALGLNVLVDFPDDDGVVRGLAGLLPGSPPVAVALPEHPRAAAGATGFDPVSFAVADRDATLAWAEHLDQLGVDHSPVTEGTLGWTFDIPDPDGIIIRLYSADRGEVDNTDLPGYARTAPGGGDSPMTGSSDVLLYYKPGCPFAARLRVALTLARIPHRCQPFGEDEQAAARVRAANGGDEVSPTVLVSDTYLVNPSVREVRAALR